MGFVVMFLVACGGSPASSETPSSAEPAEAAEAVEPTEELAAFLGAWQHDPSRDEGDVMVFVSADQDLGPARYRQTYSFAENGVASLRVLSPTDAHYTAEGRWQRSGDRNLVLVYTDSEGAEQRVELELVSVDDEALRLRHVP
jgi:hypothetical protein